MSDNLGCQFVDTNVLVYAHDISAGIKHETARDLIINLWSSRQGCISLQVLQEFYVTIVQRVVKPIAPETASRIIADLGQWPLHLPDVKDVLEAIEIQQRYKLSFWDALIICSAKKSGCDVIWTEDLNNGQRYEGVVVLNPFSG